uniref:Uncharacterized protein n=1 Tax=Onchocerca volvulus TaxID=6282 RepID=A0A8R1XTX1_ONCVO
MKVVSHCFKHAPFYMYYYYCILNRTKYFVYFYILSILHKWITLNENANVSRKILTKRDMEQTRQVKKKRTEWNSFDER